VRKFCTIRTFPHCLQASAATASVIHFTYGDLYLNYAWITENSYIHNNVPCRMLITKK